MALSNFAGPMRATTAASAATPMDTNPTAHFFSAAFGKIRNGKPIRITLTAAFSFVATIRPAVTPASPAQISLPLAHHRAIAARNRTVKKSNMLSGMKMRLKKSNGAANARKSDATSAACLEITGTRRKTAAQAAAPNTTVTARSIHASICAAVACPVAKSGSAEI